MDAELMERLVQRTPQQKIVGAISRFGKNLAKPELAAKSNEDDLASKLQYRMLENELVRDPLSDRLKEAQIGAYDAMANSPVPQGFVRIGNKIQQDPTYKAPTPLSEKDQADIERQKRADDYAGKNIKDQAQEMLNAASEVEKGMKFFGPLGNLPSVAAPSSLLGKYDDRRNWEVNMDRLTSGEIVDLINDMKSASKTGATGFGALSGPELNVLKGASTTLKRDLGHSDAQRYLNEIKNSQKKILGMPIGENLPDVESRKNALREKYGNR